MQSPRITEAAFSLPGGEGFAGGALEWITPFSILCWAGLVLGYALLGAAWLVLKTEGDLRDWAYRRLDWLLAGVVVVLIAVFAFAHVMQLRVLDRWLDDLRLVSLQLLGVIAVVGLLIGVRQRRDRVVCYGDLLPQIIYWIFRGKVGKVAPAYGPALGPPAQRRGS